VVPTGAALVVARKDEINQRPQLFTNNSPQPSLRTRSTRTRSTQSTLRANSLSSRPLSPPVGGSPATSRLTCIGASEKFTYAPIMAAGEDMSNRVTIPLKIREIPDATLRRKLLESQRDDGRPSEDDIVREHFGPRGEKQDDPAKLPVEANTRRDWPAGSAK